MSTTGPAGHYSPDPQSPAFPAVLNLQQAAVVAGVHEKTLGRWLRQGRVRGTRSGSRWILRRAELLADLAGPERDRSSS